MTAVSVEGVSKQYRLGTLGGSTVFSDVRRWWRRSRNQPDEELIEEPTTGTELHQVQRESRVRGAESFIWALRDVSFRVAPGEVLGIIGRNGAGKSTLLKILSQVTAPTTGIVKAKGRISSLLEVGTGFHPELTGRENTFLNGAILGMSRPEVRRKFDEIVEFSGVEQFIDTPVKRYSSGMYVRLAFAVAAHLEPEILVVDEVLAVGDTAFQKKCLGKMDDVAHAGRTVLLVSHNMGAIADLCENAIWLDRGQIALTGKAPTVVAAYLSKYLEPRRTNTWNDATAAPGNQTVRLLHASIDAVDGYDRDYWTVETPLILTFRVFNYRPDLPMYVDIQAYTEAGTMVFRSASDKNRQAFGILEGRCLIPPRLLNATSYTIRFSANYAGTAGVAAEGVLAFSINDVPRDIDPADKWPGVVRPELRWELRALGTDATKA
jgi:lipopolysaccharide transport system ATP-binding protein